MRWILQRWFLAGGSRSFVAGYLGCPLLVGLVIAIVARSFVAGLLVIPGALMTCVVAPLGMIAGLLCGVPGWGPWDGRLVFSGLLVGLVVLVAAGALLERPTVVTGSGEPTVQVPAARVVPTTWNQLVGRWTAVAWRPLVGPTLLVIAGVGTCCLGCAGFAVLASWG